MAYKNHRQLIVWQKGIALVKLIYQVTSTFPKTEVYGLSNQLQRAAVSIPSNIAEGQGRDSDSELDHYLRISNGSALEIDTQIEVAYILGYIDIETKNHVQSSIEEITRLISGFRKSLNVRK
ncbi:MAG: four helix bundle protein [Bacteroidales bacterium]|nr:four helix bundle protein [Bacteroidales bacterium]